MILKTNQNAHINGFTITVLTIPSFELLTRCIEKQGKRILMNDDGDAENGPGELSYEGHRLGQLHAFYPKPNFVQRGNTVYTCEHFLQDTLVEFDTPGLF